MAASDWHAKDLQAIAATLGVDVHSGLSEEEAATRLKQHGPNRPGMPPGSSPLVRFVSQLTQPLVLVLIASGAVTLLLQEWVDAGVIFGVVLVNALIGFVQEGKAETALAALARAIAAEATVLREGARRKLDAIALVPGDVVVLSAGDKIPADLRLFEIKAMRTAEATLTGESMPVDKHAEPLDADTPLADRRNMAYGGTLVVGGQAAGIVVATGDATETGRIAGLLAQTPDLATPLTRKLAEFTRYLLVVILLLAGLTFAIGVWRGETVFDMFMAAVALAVGAIPEGLPAAVTVTLAIGVARMARRKAIIRKLPAVETLGGTTVICSDKTGTLTENAMTVCEIWAGSQHFSVNGNGYAPQGAILADGSAANVTGALRETLLCGLLCNDARLVQDEGVWSVMGDPTEAALLVVARKGGLDTDKAGRDFPRLDELPFESARQYMATLHQMDGACQVYLKGALEKLLPKCASMLDDQGREVEIDRQAIQNEALRMAQAGQRVLAMARAQPGPEWRDEAELLNGTPVFLGLIGMVDPPRPRAIAAVKTCQSAGIGVKMITGDHPGTALAIARQLGIIRKDGNVLTGNELARLDDAALDAVVARTAVFARVAPEQKLRLVKALQSQGAVVAMTGDGVNDAPALKQADIGIAMGQGGTEVAKEAAAMVLTDDNFATIEAAIEEGRGIYDNLIKFIVWTIPTNAGEGLVILAAILVGATLPITPLQILWINMTTAVLLGMMLAFEPAEAGIMRRAPRSPAAPILDSTLVQRCLLVSLLLLVGAFGLFEWTIRRGQSLIEARTIAANVFVLVETAYLFNCRSLARPFWKMAQFSNPWIWFGAGSMLALQMIFTYLPAFNRVFQTAPIHWSDWLPIIAIAMMCAAVVELEKTWHLRGKGKHAEPGTS